jgi:hypothetical protein
MHIHYAPQGFRPPTKADLALAWGSTLLGPVHPSIAKRDVPLHRPVNTMFLPQLFGFGFFPHLAFHWRGDGDAFSLKGLDQAILLKFRSGDHILFVPFRRLFFKYA